MRGPEERLGRWRPPVEQQPTPRTVREPEPPDVDRRQVVRAHHAPQAQVEAVPAKGSQPGGQPTDLHVPLHDLAAELGVLLARGIEAFSQVGDRLLEALGQFGEVSLVV